MLQAYQTETKTNFLVTYPLTSTFLSADIYENAITMLKK